MSAAATQPIPEPPPEPRALAPLVADCVVGILTALVTLIGRRFPKDAFHLPLILPLCDRLARAARRFDNLMARLAAGCPMLPRPRQPSRGGARSPRLPARRGWLLSAMPEEAARMARLLRCILIEPGMAELLQAAPTAVRTLRPLCHMLGLPDPAPRPRPTLHPRPAASPRPPRPRTAPESAFRPGPVADFCAAPPPPRPVRDNPHHRFARPQTKPA